MANNNRPTLSITAGIDRKTSKDRIQQQLNKLGSELTLTIGLDKNGKGEIKKQVDEYGRLINVEKAHAQAILKDIKINESAKKKAITSEIADREKVAKIVKKQTNEELSDIERVKKAQSELARYKEDLERRLTKLSSGKFSNQLNQSAVSSIRSQGANLKIDNVGDISKVKMQTKELDSNLKNVALSAQQARTGLTRLGEESVHSFKKFSEYAIIGGIFMGIASQIKVAIKASYDLDNAINQVRIVTGQTEEQTQSLVATFKQLGKETNVSLVDTANLYADLTRQGLEGGALEDRFKAISKYSKISGLDVSKSMDIITSAVNGTKRPVEEIIDTFAVLGDKSSADSAEIGEALQRTASVASIAGIDFKKLSSYIATISETTRTAASVVGQSVRSMIVRFNQLREQGFNEEDTTKVNDVIQALSTIGIDAFDDSTQSLMNFSEILEQLAPKWDTLDEKTRNYLQTSLAGNFQADKFAALMSNYTRAQELYGYALDSSGQATAKFEIYQESAQAKVEKFQLSLENLYTTLVGSNFLKGVIDFGTQFVDTLSLATKETDTLVASIVALSSAIVALRASALVSEGGLLVGMGLSAPILTAIALAVGVLATTFVSYQKSLEDAKIAAENFKKAQDELNFVMGVGGDSATKLANDISDTVDLYEEQERRVNAIKDSMEKLASTSGQSKESAKKYSELQKKLVESKDSLSELENKLAEYGVTSDTARQKVQELNDAYDDSKKSTDALTKLNLAQTQQKELDTVKNLVSTYDTWIAKKNKSKKEDEQVSKISTVLASKLEDLGIAYETNADGIVINTDSIKGLILAKVDLTNATIDSATKDMQIEKNRLNSILNNIKIELEARKILAGAIANSAKSQIVQEFDVGEQRAYSNTALAGQNTSFLEGKLEQTKNDVQAITDAQNQLAKTISGTTGLLGGGAGGKDTSKSTKDKITLMTAFEKALEANSFATETLQGKLSLLSEEDARRIPLIKDEIKLYQQRQKLLTDEATRARAELSKLQSKKNTTDAEKKRMEELTEKISQYSNEWFTLAKNVQTANESITKSSEESAKKVAEAQEKAIEETQNLYKDLAKALEEQDKQALEKKKRDAEDRIDIVDEELKTLERMYQSTTDKIESDDLSEKISKLESERLMRSVEGSLDANARIYEIDEELVELRKQQAELTRKNTYETEKNKLEDKKESIQDEIRTEERAYEDKKTQLKYFEQARQMIIQGSSDEILRMLKTYDEQYRIDGETKGQAWLTAFLAKVSQASQYIGSVAGGVTKVSQASQYIGSVAGGVTISSSGVGHADPSKASPTQVKKYSSGAAQGMYEYMLDPKTSASEKAEAQDWLTKFGRSYEIHHEGIDNGLVGSMGLPLPKNYEQFALLAKGEGVLTKDHMSNLNTGISALKSMIPKQFGGNGNGVTINQVVNAVINNELDIRDVGKKLAQYTSNDLTKIGVRI